MKVLGMFFSLHTIDTSVHNAFTSIYPLETAALRMAEIFFLLSDARLPTGCCSHEALESEVSVRSVAAE